MERTQTFLAVSGFVCNLCLIAFELRQVAFCRSAKKVLHKIMANYWLGKKVSEHYVQSTKFYYFSENNHETIIQHYRHCYLPYSVNIQAYHRFICNRKTSVSN